MWKSNLDEALDLGAISAAARRNGWWRVEFTTQDDAEFFLAYAEEQAWTVIGSGLVLGVRL